MGDIIRAFLGIGIFIFVAAWMAWLFRETRM